MKNLLLATTIAIVTSSAAVADVVRARITHVEPRYETVYNKIDCKRPECGDRESNDEFGVCQKCDDYER